MADRLNGQILAEPVISPQGEFLADAGEKIDKIKAMEIEDEVLCLHLSMWTATR